MNDCATMSAETTIDLRELDQAIATRLMGWSVHRQNWGCPPSSPQQIGAISLFLPEAVPAYSTDIVAIGNVVTHLSDWDFSLTRHNGRWTARFIKWGKVKHATGEADSAMLAICLAALETDHE